MCDVICFGFIIHFYDLYVTHCVKYEDKKEIHIFYGLYVKHCTK